MRLTESLSSHLAHLALEAIRKSGAEVRNDRLALAEIKKTLARHLDQDSKIDEAVRRRIASLQRRVVPGSSEYDVLYRQYYEQETRKHRP
ncbi:DUF507 family protein [bacterium]|nr:DUF507 family protein [bacterium]